MIENLSNIRHESFKNTFLCRRQSFFLVEWTKTMGANFWELRKKYLIHGIIFLSLLKCVLYGMCVAHTPFVAISGVQHS